MPPTSIVPDAGARRGLSLVAVGGGTGLAALLRGLKPRVGCEVTELTAVVTMTDDGGSSGRLRRDFGIPPPGDIRNCLAALADDEDLLVRLFQYRFAGGEGLSGHSFGNLLLTALTGITGDFSQAVLTAEKILSVRGRILPSTLTDVRLRGLGVSGRSYEGESAVGRSGEQLAALAIEPAAPPAFPPAAEALRGADLILLGPGSLYTSILPNLLIPGIRSAIAQSRAPVLLLMNLMTQPGETDGMDATAHLEAIEKQVRARIVNAVLANLTRPAPALLAAYSETGARPVEVDRTALEGHGVAVFAADLLAPGELVRHHPGRLAEALLATARELLARPAAVRL